MPNVLLKTAMHEIKEILVKHNIAGVVVLHTPGHSEYLMKIDPTYSCATYQGEGIKIRAKLKEDFNGNEKAWTKKKTDTSNMFSLLAQVTGSCAVNLMEVSEAVDKVIGAEHGPGTHTTDNS